MGVGIIGLIVAVFVVIAAVNHGNTLQDRKNRAGLLADELGLSIEGHDELVGQYAGVPVRCYSKDLGHSSNTDWWTFTRCRLLEPLPDGMVVANQGMMGHLADLFGMEDVQIGTALDPKLRINATRPAEARELLTDPEVHRALDRILTAGGKIELRGDHLEVKVRGRHLLAARQRVEEATGLARALRQAGLGHWEALAARLGLPLEGEGNRIRGRVSGLDLKVAFVREGMTQVRVACDPPLPPETVLTHKDEGFGEETLNDPILPTMLAIRSSDPEALAARVATDVVRGPLLEVVHGYPGSQLRSDAVYLVAPGRLGRGLGPAVDVALELGRVLRGPDAEKPPTGRAPGLETD